MLKQTTQIYLNKAAPQVLPLNNVPYKACFVRTRHDIKDTQIPFGTDVSSHVSNFRHTLSQCYHLMVLVVSAHTP